MSQAEDYLPYIAYDSVVILDSAIGTQLGAAIIHSEDVWHNSDDEPVFSLLDADGSTYSILLYPELYAVLGTNTLDNIPTEQESPPYKIVADYIGA